MKCLSILFVLIFGSSIFGQNIIATTHDGRRVILKPNKTWEYAVKETSRPEPVTLEVPLTYGWILITTSDDSTDSVSYYYQPKTLKKREYRGTEGWIRLIPKSIATFIKKHKLPAETAFIQQFMSVDCAEERISIESTVFYDKKSKIVGANRFWNSYGEKVVPNSVGESWFKAFCN